MTEYEVKQLRQEAQDRIREWATEDYLKPDKTGKGYICPVCGSGSGPKGTGITENPKSRGHFTCWAGCFDNSDIFHIIGLQYGLTNFNEQFEKACELSGIKPDYDTSYTWPSPKTNTGNKSQNNKPVDVVEDYTEFYKQAAANIYKTDYHRGISLETLKKFNVGYVEEWRHPKAPANVPTSPRLIVPIWLGGHLARDTRANLTDEQKKYSKMRIGEVRLFNQAALNQTSKPVYVVEGEFDALSIIDVGGQALALCSVANVDKLIEVIKKQTPKVPLIIQLDEDKSGQNAARKLIEGLRQAEFLFYRQYSLPEPYKDANEFLMADREGFSEWVKIGERLNFDAAKEEIMQAEQEAREAFEHEAVSYRLEKFMQFVLMNKEGGGISTGFENLDHVLDGGLYPGLYVIGANSSLGKTTILLQIGDNIAQAGHGVLIFSLEMEANELISKTFSRLSLTKSLDKYSSRVYAKTTRGILLGRFNNDIEQEIFMQSMNEYGKWGDNIHITEGIGDVGISQITDKVKEYIKHKNESPVVIIDYLQILTPYSVKMTDKQNIDKNITELKRLSRDYGISILGISSFNRENYSNPVSMASFKESGAIEYSSDVLIGLQYNGWDYQEGEKEPARLARLRGIRERMDQAARDCDSQEIQLKVLKNRNGIRKSLLFDFYPAFNYFAPIKEA